MAETILQNELVVYILLPFILVFAVIFGVLQKTEILGKGKKQIDAIVSFAIALMLVAFLNYTQIIVQLSAFLAVSLIIILVFMILVGIMYKPGEFAMDKTYKNIIMAIAFIAVAIAVLVYTGNWDKVLDLFSGGTSAWITNIIAIGLIALAVWFVMGESGNSSGK
jgi:FlaA1/EpsC-like NDP-sugar epimerase